MPELRWDFDIELGVALSIYACQLDIRARRFKMIFRRNREEMQIYLFVSFIMFIAALKRHYTVI